MPPAWHSRHGLDRLRPRRIEQPDQAEQNQVLRQIRRAEVTGIYARILQPCQGQHALALRRQLVRRVREIVAVDRRSLPASDCLPVAMLEDDLGRPLDQQKLLAGGIVVQCRHEAVFRFERDRVQPRIGRLLGLPFEAKLVAERVESPLGRVAFHLPGAFFLADFRIVTEHRDAPHQPENRVLACRRAVFQHLAFGCVALAGDFVGRIGGDGGHHHHLHQGQGSGLVGANPRDRAQGFDRRQPTNDGVALGHALHADCQGDGDQRRQALRDNRHGDADDRLKDGDEIHALRTQRP